jgi:peptidoglycan/LPS O-acetylase OafA/YrhL
MNQDYKQTLWILQQLPVLVSGLAPRAVSGFFIGGQLWKERRDSGSVAVGRFILRRGFRIWPLYFFAFVCVLTFALTFGHGAAAKQYGWSDLVFLTNFYNRGMVMGSWSLCIEEQFYIVAPLVLYFSSRHVRSIRMYRPWLWGLLLFIPLLRTVIWVHGTGHFFQPNAALFSSLYYGSITHCDELVMGLIISNLWVTREKPVSKFATPGILVAVAVALLIGLHQLQKEIFDFSALALLFGSLVWFGIQRRTAIFNSRIFYWISRLSFGMYLNHEYMCPWIVRAVLSRLPFAAQLPLFANLMGVVLVVTLSIAVAIVTFCGVEYPFLQIRKTVLGHHTDRPGSLESVPQRHSFGG